MAKLTRGSFGFFAPDFAVTKESVTLSRKPLLLAFVALIPLGVYLLAQPFDEAWRGRGVVWLLASLGLFCLPVGWWGFTASPLMRPSRVRISKAGVRWGGLRLSPAEIKEVKVDHAAQRAGQATTYVWSLVVKRNGAAELRLRLTESFNTTVPPDVDRVLAAARRLLRSGDDQALDGLPQWAPDGSEPKLLSEPLSEPTFRQHLAEGREIERALYGTYTVVALDVKTGPRVMKYLYRLLVLPREGEDPVLAVNLELSPFGTCAIGVHRGGAHVNFGDADPDMPYEAFRHRALAILGEELLGIPAG